MGSSTDRGGAPRALWSKPPEYRRRSPASKLGPSVAVVDCPNPWLTAGRLVGRLGYMMDEAVELWRDCGENPEEADGLGEWPEVYDMALDGGVTAGVPVDEMAVRGDAMLAAETGWW